MGSSHWICTSPKAHLPTQDADLKCAITSPQRCFTTHVRNPKPHLQKDCTSQRVLDGGRYKAGAWQNRRVLGLRILTVCTKMGKQEQVRMSFPGNPQKGSKDEVLSCNIQPYLNCFSVSVKSVEHFIQQSRLPRTKAYQAQRPPFAFHTTWVCLLCLQSIWFLHWNVKWNSTAHAITKIRNLKTPRPVLRTPYGNNHRTILAQVLFLAVLPWCISVCHTTLTVWL